MHTAIMIDEGRWRSERAWLNRTVVGLVSAGVQVTRVVPEEDSPDQSVALTASIPLVKQSLPWSQRAQRQRLTSQLGAAGVTLIHALGVDTWSTAVRAGEALGIPVIIDIWARAELSQAIKYARSNTVAGVFAASEGLARSLKKKLDPALIAMIPMGVYIPDLTKEILGGGGGAGAGGGGGENTEGVGAILAGRGAVFDDLAGLLDGFAAVHSKYPESMLFADLDPGMSRRIWDLARRRGILDSFSLIPSVEENRKLVLQADLLLVPTATGRSSSFVLEAMASPMVPILRYDPFVSQPTDREGGRLLEGSTGAIWTDVLDEIIADREHGRVLADGARDWVAATHRMSWQINAMQEAYELILTGGAVRLPISNEG